MLKASEAQFQTGWFIESILSAMLVIFVVRTRLPFNRSVPSRLMMAATLVIALIVLLIPYSPVAGLLGFTRLPFIYLPWILGIVVLYVAAAEVTKRWFYRRVHIHG